MTASIFLQIASYRDPDLPATLHNLIQQAANPDRLRFGICLQLADDDPSNWGTNAFPEHPQISICSFAAADSQGACWARRQAQGFYDGEDFLLQIDSHMRAVEHWDELMLQTWHECGDAQAVLSVYPNGFQLPNQLQTATLPVMAADRFDQNGILKLKGIGRYRLPEDQPDCPIPSAFIAGGFLFGPGSIISDVPYDPELYFDGEEIALSARLWTQGYNLYCPNRLLLFHLYKTSQDNALDVATHWGDHPDWNQRNRCSLKRVHTLLGSLHTAPPSVRACIANTDDLDPYGLGTLRSLSMYQQWSGVNFARAEISEEAKNAQFKAIPDSS